MGWQWLLTISLVVVIMACLYTCRLPVESDTDTDDEAQVKLRYAISEVCGWHTI